MSNVGWATKSTIDLLLKDGAVKIDPSNERICSSLISSALEYTNNLPNPEKIQCGWGEYNKGDKVGDDAIQSLLTDYIASGIHTLFDNSRWPRHWAGAQIAYQFPRDGRIARKVGFHVDGYPDPEEGKPKMFNPLSLLIGILLHPVCEDGGAFCYVPGSHTEVAQRFEKQTGETRRDRLKTVGDDWDRRSSSTAAIGDAGTIFILDPLTIHGTRENETAKRRTMVFFRIRQSKPWEVDLDSSLIGQTRPGWNGLSAILAQDASPTS